MYKVNSLEKAILNLISDPYDKENCFYGHVIAQCNIHVNISFNAIAGVTYFNDAFQLYINPNRFSIYTLKEQKAILIHEAMHMIFNHIPRLENKNHIAWNIAADAAINQYIKNLPQGCIYPKTLGKKDEMYAEYYYEHISIDSIKKCCAISNQFIQKELHNKGQYQNIDSHELWEKSNNELTEEFSKQVCQSIIDNATEKNRGYIPQSANIAIKLLNAPSQVPWQKILKRIMGSVKKYYEPSYKKVNRRFPQRVDLPGKQAFYKPTLVCIVDVSGSMSNKEISTSLAEIQHICNITRHKLLVLQVDTVVQNISEVDFKNHNFTRKGCGGTDLYPAVEYIYENKIPNDMLVFITDGYFGFESWKKMPKTIMFFLLTCEDEFVLPTKKSYKANLKI